VFSQVETDFGHKLSYYLKFVYWNNKDTRNDKGKKARTVWIALFLRQIREKMDVSCKKINALKILEKILKKIYIFQFPIENGPKKSRQSQKNLHFFIKQAGKSVFPLSEKQRKMFYYSL
jgi:hypothetical protein